MNKPDRILAFAHIPKSGGITTRYLLRRYFGLKHLDTKYRTSRGPIYTASNLRTDLRILPGLKSIAGHALKPFIDFEENSDRLAWYTMLRDPISRVISHYQHEVEKGGEKLSLDQWVKQHARRSNWQVRMLAGEEDLEAAKQIIAEKFLAVGILERYDESLKVIFKSLGLPNFPIYYERPKNKSGALLKKQLYEQLDELRDLIEEHNSLDIELYQHVSQNTWLAQAPETPAPWQAGPLPAARANWNLATNFLFRNLFYKPWARAGLALSNKRDRRQSN